jgi:hypothetical protein
MQALDGVEDKNIFKPRERPLGIVVFHPFQVRFALSARPPGVEIC